MGEREGEKHWFVVGPHVPLTGALAHNPGMCPDWELNQQPFASQSGAQSTEPYQPGPFITHTHTQIYIHIHTHIYFKDFIYLLLERGREGERKRNIYVWLPLEWPLLETLPTTQACALIGNRTGNPLVSRLVLNPLSHTSQGQCIYFFDL